MLETLRSYFHPTDLLYTSNIILGIIRLLSFTKMAAVVAFRQPILPTASTIIPAPALLSRPSSESLRSEPKPTQPANVKISRGRRDRPCDACRRKKSRCVMNEGQTNNCVACSAHGNQCTFLEDPRPRKRRLDSDGKNAESGKRRSAHVKITTPNGHTC